jgi:hypothetical protein
LAADVRIRQEEIETSGSLRRAVFCSKQLPFPVQNRPAVRHSVGKFMLPRSLGENPIFPNSPINCETSPDLISLKRYRVINVAAISTRNLSALVSHQPRDCISCQAALIGFGRFSGGSGNAAVTMGSYCRALRRLGRFLNPPLNSSNAVGILGLAMWVPKFQNFGCAFILPWAGESLFSWQGILPPMPIHHFHGEWHRHAV